MSETKGFLRSASLEDDAIWGLEHVNGGSAYRLVIIDDENTRHPILWPVRLHPEILCPSEELHLNETEGPCRGIIPLCPKFGTEFWELGVNMVSSKGILVAQNRILMVGVMREEPHRR